MRITISIPKLFLLVALSCSLLIARDCNRYEYKGEPTNIESASTASESIWDSMSRELNLDHRDESAQVQAEIHKLLADQGELYRILQASGPYIYFIYQQTQEHHLPAELALIPVIESEFNPNDTSSKAGARGLWQLMPQTAHELGIKVREGYDGRKDVIASTHAALAYFKDLGNMFNNNWYLAIAAYNCGQGRIFSAMHHSGSSNFWSLRVPTETKLYVPRLLAVAAIVKDPEKYGVQLPNIGNQPYFTDVKIDKPMNLTQVAKKIDVNVQTLNKLNPDYKNGMVAKQGEYTVLVPVAAKPQLNKLSSNDTQHDTQTTTKLTTTKSSKKSTKHHLA